MTFDEFVNAFLGRPSCSGWNASPDDKLVAVKGAVDVILRQIMKKCRKAPWSEGIQTIQTVASEPLYKVEGINADCSAVMSVRYSTTLDLLTKVDPDRYESYQSGRTSEEEASTPIGWCPAGGEGGFPVIRIIPAPDTADIPLTVRYRRGAMKFEELPQEHWDVLTYGVEAHLFGAVGTILQKGELGTQVQGSINYDGRYSRHLSLMIDAYKRGSQEESPAPTDSTWRSNNRRRNAKFGFR